MSENIKREETQMAEMPLEEEALEDAAGGAMKSPHTRKPREYESQGG